MDLNDKIDYKLKGREKRKRTRMLKSFKRILNEMPYKLGECIEYKVNDPDIGEYKRTGRVVGVDINGNIVILSTGSDRIEINSIAASIKKIDKPLVLFKVGDMVKITNEKNSTFYNMIGVVTDVGVPYNCQFRNASTLHWNACLVKFTNGKRCWGLTEFDMIKVNS